MDVRFYNLLFFLIVAYSLNAFAIGEWTPPNVIDQINSPLEIAGGKTYTDNEVYDTFIVLNEGQLPLNKLDVYNINGGFIGCSLEGQSTVTGFDGPIFGTSHKIVGTTDKVFFAGIIDDFRLKVVRSDDGGITWNIFTVSNNQFYGSSEVAVDPTEPNKVFVGGCNAVDNSYEIFQADGPDYNNWSIAWDIGGVGVNCAIEGVTRATMNVIQGHGVILYGHVIGGNQQEIYIHRDSGDTKIDIDILTPVGSVNESYPPNKLENGLIVVPYFNRKENYVKAASFEIVNGVDVMNVGSAPDFTTFFGIGCFEGPPGIANILYPGGNHFQMNNNSLEKIPTIGNFFKPNGPIGNTLLTITIMPELIDPATVVSDFNSIGCGKFFLQGAPQSSVPTLSEWGLIAMASILGIVGYMIIRRRKASA